MNAINQMNFDEANMDRVFLVHRVHCSMPVPPTPFFPEALQFMKK
jgi:hypothetical protein